MSGRTQRAEKILTIDIQKGWKAGTKITFEKEGDERPGIKESWKNLYKESLQLI